MALSEVFRYDTLPELRGEQFSIANTDNIYPGLEPVQGGHHWVTVCCSSDLLLVFDSFGRSLAQMEKDYTELQLRAYFLWAYPDRTVVTNAFAVQDRSTAVCGHYAVLGGRLFVEEEGPVETTLASLRDLFSGDTVTNDQRVVDLAPVQQGGGDPDDSGYASDDEKNQRSPRRGLLQPQGLLVWLCGHTQASKGCGC